ncbi:MAG: hypothetical protein K2Y22_16005 [Candidatus Obscuribacterales bacterium]|nr:hypothetical protein [Candidatus Obscuribacterales bacterium]
MNKLMKKYAVLLSLAWFSTSYCAFAEEPYSTQISITGKESGPYKLSATVKTVKKPYKMDPNKNITNEDLARVLHPFMEGTPFDVRKSDVKQVLDDMDKPQQHSQHPSSPSVGAHPATTATIQDTVEEIEPDQVEKPEYDDEHYRQIDMALQRARNDLQTAQDDLSRARSERERQEAIGRIDNAKDRIQRATSAQ